MLEEYFANVGAVTPENAWKHVYRLLLWIDSTTALAHCYESDKCQPGRTWYARSLAFHAWVSTALGAPPDQLSVSVDWLFRHGTALLAAGLAAIEERRTRYAAVQRAPYEGRRLPEPGADPDIERIVREELAPYISRELPATTVHGLTRRIRAHLMQENKRKNLVGEGFEDVLAYVIRHLPRAAQLEIRTRTLLSALPGFHPPPRGDKERKVDLAVLAPHRRTLVSAKWSVRADREEQFISDFEAYARLENLRERFDFILVTNEFDAARLAAACELRAQNAPLFSAVVHVNPDGVIAAYGADLRHAAATLPGHLETRRLISLQQWLESLA